MRILTLNINPPNKSKIDISMLSDAERTERIIGLLNKMNPDVIFFIEQWYPVFNAVQVYLERISYTFYKPDCFDPSSCTRGEYRSYAGIIVAVKKEHKATASDGTGFVNEIGKWLSIEIDSAIYLGVHYPQPGIEWDNFNQDVERFSKEKSPLIIIGDFNTPLGRSVMIKNYRDVLPGEPTCTTNKKLDYIFVKNGIAIEDEELMNAVRTSGHKMLFSDHSVTSVTI